MNRPKKTAARVKLNLPVENSVRLGGGPVEEGRVEIRVLAFANAAEILGAPETRFELADDARVGDAWARLEERHPALAPLRESMRLARNGRLTSHDEPLRDGDEIAVLPPVGGG